MNQQQIAAALAAMAESVATLQALLGEGNAPVSPIAGIPVATAPHTTPFGGVRAAESESDASADRHPSNPAVTSQVIALGIPCDNADWDSVKVNGRSISGLCVWARWQGAIERAGLSGKGAGERYESLVRRQMRAIGVGNPVLTYIATRNGVGVVVEGLTP